MLRLAILAVLLSAAAAALSPGTFPGITSPDNFNEHDKKDISLFKPCTDLEQFRPEMLGYWKGRTQMTEQTYLKEYDIHSILKDGSGFVNARSEKDHTKIARETPTKMWCKTYENGVDKSVKVQYGPTRYGQLICIDLEVSDSRPDIMLVGVNQVLFTDSRLPMLEPVALDCLNYLYQSKYNSFTVWADNPYRVSYSEWDRTTAPVPGSDSEWTFEKKDALTALLLKALLKKNE